jgi:hypothetical protein
MSYTIFTSNHTSLIAQPGRAVNTFPSGLVRVDQVYLGLTSQAATHRATLAVGNDMPDGDSSPCIDGLKIFPEVQELRREDGFTEFIVSAYGRSHSTAVINSSFEEGVAVLNKAQSNDVSQTILRAALFQSVNFLQTLPQSSLPVFNTTSFTPQIYIFADFEEASRLSVALDTPVLVSQAYPGTPISTGRGTLMKTYYYNYKNDFQETNFGSFKEATKTSFITARLEEFLELSP